MTAQEARKMTDIANSQSGELARIYKKIEKAVLKGDSYITRNNILEENILTLKRQGYDVLDKIDEYLIEW